MAAADPQRIRAIKIKTGVVKRLVKEKVYYEAEAKSIQVKVDKMPGEGKDEYEIKKMEEVLRESQMMIPDCERKSKVAYDELTRLMETESDLSDSVEYKEALKILEENKP